MARADGRAQAVEVRRGVSRRGFLTRGGAAALAGVGLGACTDERELSAPARSDGAATDADVHCAARFFNEHEAATVEAMTARILPGDADDPGAREMGAVAYIDCLMGTGVGFAEPVYLMPPFPAPEPEDLAPLQEAYPDLPPLVRGGDPDETPGARPGDPGVPGIAAEGMRDDSVESSSFGVLPLPKNTFDRYGWQSLLNPPELYRRGIRAMDGYCGDRFGARFVDLDDGQQDEVLTALEDGEAEGFDVPSPDGFFELVRRHTIEAVFSDPMYGSNRDLGGWRLLGYPGAQRAYTPDEVRDPSFRRDPQSLRDLHRFHPGDADREEPVLPVSGGDVERRRR